MPLVIERGGRSTTCRGDFTEARERGSFRFGSRRLLRFTPASFHAGLGEALSTGHRRRGVPRDRCKSGMSEFTLPTLISDYLKPCKCASDTVFEVACFCWDSLTACCAIHWKIAMINVHQCALSGMRVMCAFSPTRVSDRCWENLMKALGSTIKTGIGQSNAGLNSRHRARCGQNAATSSHANRMKHTTSCKKERKATTMEVCLHRKGAANRWCLATVKPGISVRERRSGEITCNMFSQILPANVRAVGARTSNIGRAFFNKSARANSSPIGHAIPTSIFKLREAQRSSTGHQTQTTASAVDFVWCCTYTTSIQSDQVHTAQCPLRFPAPNGPLPTARNVRPECPPKNGSNHHTMPTIVSECGG